MTSLPRQHCLTRWVDWSGMRAVATAMKRTRTSVMAARAGYGELARLSLVVLALAALGGCASDRGTAADTLPLRTDVVWQLGSIQPSSGPIVPAPDPSLYTVRFGADGRLAARADCNRCAGPYRVAGSSLTVGPLACTRAACPLGSLDGQFTAGLTGVASYVQTRDTLVLLFDGGALRFRASE
jgi:heat shock protein HslJ